VVQQVEVVQAAQTVAWLEVEADAPPASPA
jgi:hypothetical protein